MAATKKVIFRNNAIKHYTNQSGNNNTYNVYPRFIPTSVMIGLWVMLGLLIVIGALAWEQQVPVYVTGSGIVLAKATHKNLAGQTDAAVFLSPAQAASLRIGLPVQIHLASASTQLTSKIVEIEPGLISPDLARKNYGLDGAGSLTQPSVVILVNVGTQYARGTLTAQVQIGTQRILPSLLGINQGMRS